MYKESDIQDDRNKKSDIDELISTPWHAIRGGSPDFGGLYQIYDNDMQDMYSEKSASVKEAGNLEMILTKLKNWWETRKKTPEAVEQADSDKKGKTEPEKKASVVFSDDPVQNSYWNGFADKCAEDGVDPSELAEAMFRIAGDM